MDAKVKNKKDERFLFRVISRLSRRSVGVKGDVSRATFFFFLFAFSLHAQTPYYYLDRSFSAVQFDLQGIPTEYQLNQEADKLTDIVAGEVVLNTNGPPNGTYAIEKQAAIPICLCGHHPNTSKVLHLFLFFRLTSRKERLFFSSHLEGQKK